MLNNKVVVSHLHNVCSQACPPTGLNYPSTSVGGVARLKHLVCHPLMWAFHGIQFPSFWPCLGLRAGLTMGWNSWNFRLGPSCQGMAVQGALVGVGSWAGKLGALLFSGAMSSAKKRVMF